MPSTVYARTIKPILDCNSSFQGCNCNQFHEICRKELASMKTDFDVHSLPLDPSVKLRKASKSWVLVETPPNVIHERLTSAGILIQVNKVPHKVIFEQAYFYVCVDCGKCYWGMDVLRYKWSSNT